MLRSVAKAHGENAIGVVLTGMGSDGVEGLKELKRSGAKTIAQDEETCTVFGMPKAAIEEGIIDEVVPADKIAGQIIKMLRKGQKSA